MLIGSVIVPAVIVTPTTIGVAASAIVGKAALVVAIVDEKTMPVASVNVAVATPAAQADDVAVTPKPDTVAVPVFVQVKVTVSAFVPDAANATFVTLIDPLASASETAGASWLFTEEPVM